MIKLAWYWKLLGFLILIGIIAGALYALYSAGVSAGKLEGDKEGYKRAWDSQQVLVNSLTKTINDNRTATNSKITELEGQANALQAENNQLKLTTQRRVDDAIETFKLENPQIASSCGLSIQTVGALRKAMGVKP